MSVHTVRYDGYDLPCAASHEGHVSLDHLCNLTGDDINLVGRVFPAASLIPRIASTDGRVGPIGDVPVWEVHSGDVVDLPAPMSHMWYIVPRHIAEALPHRRDLVFPLVMGRDLTGRGMRYEDVAQVPAPRWGGVWRRRRRAHEPALVLPTPPPWGHTQHP